MATTFHTDLRTCGTVSTKMAMRRYPPSLNACRTPQLTTQSRISAPTAKNLAWNTGSMRLMPAAVSAPPCILSIMYVSRSAHSAQKSSVAWNVLGSRNTYHPLGAPSPTSHIVSMHQAGSSSRGRMSNTAMGTRRAQV